MNATSAKILEEWEKDGRPFDHAILLMTLNAAAGRAVKLIRDHEKRIQGGAA